MVQDYAYLNGCGVNTLMALVSGYPVPATLQEVCTGHMICGLMATHRYPRYEDHKEWSARAAWLRQEMVNRGISR